MAAGPIVKKKTGSPIFKVLAGLALLIIIGVVVLSAAPTGCQLREPHDAVSNGIERVTINGKTFNLELAADNPTRMRGLGGREHIPEDGGMLFVFKVPNGLRFVMRDCVIPIDIIFVDHSGVVTAVHTMPPEDPQGPNETDFMYEDRLKKYSSRFVAQFAIELQAGQIDKLGVKAGDKIDLDVDRLQRLAE